MAKIQNKKKLTYKGSTMVYLKQKEERYTGKDGNLVEVEKFTNWVELPNGNSICIEVLPIKPRGSISRFDDNQKLFILSRVSFFES